MNFKIPVAGLLIGLLVACSETKYDPTVQSTPKQQQVRQSKPEIKQPPETGATKPTNPFDRASFPKESCGDKLPNDSKTDTVNFYPVFIDYTESNLRAVKANYCRDALKKLKKDQGKEVIQVASFTSEERANQFKEFLENKLGSISAEVGEPRIIAVNPKGNIKPQAKQTKHSSNNLSSAISIGKAALLTPDQVKQLISVGKNVHLQNGEIKNLEIVVPTYIPPGFKLDRIEASAGDYPRYNISYRNSNNVCFGFGAFTSPGAGSAGEYDQVEVSAPALGKVTLTYTDFDDSNKPLVAFYSYGSNVRDKEVGKYAFASGSYPDPNCNAISLQEAIKIVESLQFLNP